jgi:hypothetical protein
MAYGLRYTITQELRNGTSLIVKIYEKSYVGATVTPYIGTIVSLPKDKSTDYLVLDYKYRKLDGKYYIDFIVSEMINNKGSVITYGEIYTFRESELCYSRNSRIDNILN